MFIPGYPSNMAFTAGRRVVLVASAVLAFAQWPTAVGAEEPAWELVGTFVSLKPGEPEVAIFRVADGATVNVPLAAFSESSRNRIAAMAGSSLPIAVAENEPFSTDIQAGLENCRTAAEAADLCRSLLAEGHLPDNVRVAIGALQDSWDARALLGEVRFGTEWVPAAVAAAASSRGDEQIRQAGELIRLGNLKLAAEKLEEAAAIDPNSGRAHFFIGLAYLLIGRPELDKAGAAFSQVVRREPANGAAWNNLAICELQRRRSAGAVEAFRQAAAQGADPNTLAANLAFVLRLAADRRSRIPEKAVDDLSHLYHQVIRDHALTPIDSANVPILLGPENVALVGTDAAELGRLASSSFRTAGGVELPGLVVAAGIVAVPAVGLRAVDQADQFVVVTPTNPAAPARAKATIADGMIVLLECEGLDVEPLPLAEQSPGEKAEMFVMPLPHAVGGVADGLLPSPTAARMAAPLSGRERRRFVYEVSVDSVPVGAAITDQMGRLVGLSAPSPRGGVQGQRLWIGVPVEEIRAVLGFDEASSVPSGGAETLDAEAIGNRVSHAIVRWSRGNGGTQPPIR